MTEIIVALAIPGLAFGLYIIWRMVRAAWFGLRVVSILEQDYRYDEAALEALRGSKTFADFLSDCFNKVSGIEITPFRQVE